MPPSSPAPEEAIREVLWNALSEQMQIIFRSGSGAWLQGSCDLNALAAAIAAWNRRAEGEREQRLEEALRDMLAGWRYIRTYHGDLYGVGWDRCEQAASAALARAEGE